MNRFLFLLSAVATLGLGATNQAWADGDSVKFEAHGFVSTTAYYQSTQSFVQNGQGPFVASSTDQTPVFGFDIRQTRLNVSATGPQVMRGATPRAFIETDFFGLNGAGSYGEVSFLPRLRAAYAELNWGSTVVRAGQDWQLLMVNLPVTLSHMANPFFGSGFIGWREPGVGITHSRDWRSSKFEFAGQILKSDWLNPVVVLGQTTPGTNNVDAGQISARPGLEARVKWTRDNVSAFLAGHWNRVSGAGHGALASTATLNTAEANPNRDFDVLVFKLGAKAKVARFTLLGEIYSGKNLGPLQGNLLQFPTLTDIHEIGGWAQVGYDINEKWSAFLVYTTSQPNHGDAYTANSATSAFTEPRLSDSVTGLLVQYREGAFAAGPEIFVAHTAFAANGGATNRQYALTANYTF